MPSTENEEVVNDAPIEELDVGTEQVQETPEVESVAAETQQVETPKPAWYQALGMDDVADESAAVERLRHQLTDAQRIAEENRQYQMLLYQERQRQQQAQQVQQPQVQKPKREVPEFHPSWLEMVTKDDGGNLVSKPGADPTLPSKIQAYAKWREDEINGFIRDPSAMLNEFYETALQSRVQELIQSQMEQYHNTMAVNAWENQHRDLIYAPNSQNLTPAGQRIVQYANEEMRLGVADKLQALNRGVQRLHYELLMSGGQQQPAPAPKPPAQVSQDKKETFLRTQAQRKPSRSGAIQDTETNPAPRSRFDFKTELLANLEKAGIGPNDKIAID